MSASSPNGALFAPKYIENKLKFYPNIREVVAYGDGRDFVTCFINIDITAVGNWAERNNVVYGSYQELAANPRVYELIEQHVAEVNRSLASEDVMAGAQIKRFLILHKELDADDGEMTRTQKVRRGFVAERYEPLIDALYDGSNGGRHRDRGDVRGRPQGHDARAREDRRHEDRAGGRANGEGGVSSSPLAKLSCPGRSAA